MLIQVHVVTLRHLREAAARYPDAAKEIAAWYAFIKDGKWTNFVELRRVFPDSDYVDGYVVFNIRQNRYRLITIIHYARMRNGVQTAGHLYIRSFLTHREYDHRDNWDKEYGR